LSAPSTFFKAICAGLIPDGGASELDKPTNSLDAARILDRLGTTRIFSKNPSSTFITIEYFNPFSHQQWLSIANFLPLYTFTF
jgi:hypothetical protein